MVFHVLSSSVHSILLRCRRLRESFFDDRCLEYDVDWRGLLEG